MSIRLSSDELSLLEEDELNLVLYVVQQHMGLDPIFIKSIKKKKIFEMFLSIENQLSPTGKEIFKNLSKKIFL